MSLSNRHITRTPDVDRHADDICIWLPQVSKTKNQNVRLLLFQSPFLLRLAPRSLTQSHSLLRLSPVWCHQWYSLHKQSVSNIFRTYSYPKNVINPFMRRKLSTDYVSVGKWSKFVLTMTCGPRASSSFFWPIGIVVGHTMPYGYNEHNNSHCVLGPTNTQHTRPRCVHPIVLALCPSFTHDAPIIQTLKMLRAFSCHLFILFYYYYYVLESFVLSFSFWITLAHTILYI